MLVEIHITEEEDNYRFTFTIHSDNDSHAEAFKNAYKGKTGRMIDKRLYAFLKKSPFPVREVKLRFNVDFDEELKKFTFNYR